MKKFVILFGTMAIICLLGGLFGKTPSGEPATHMLILSGFCGAFTFLFYIEYKKENDRG